MAYDGFDLSGKVAVITGGNGGIGLGFARAIAAAGADVSIWGTNPEKNAIVIPLSNRDNSSDLRLRCHWRGLSQDTWLNINLNST